MLNSVRKVSSRLLTFSTPTDIFFPVWMKVAERPARKLESIVLPEHEASSILQDCQNFLKDDEWYNDRGIPHRRGYLLHGLPGCGKSSLVGALAGEMKLNIYNVNLAQSDLTDQKLLGTYLLLLFHLVIRCNTRRV